MKGLNEGKKFQTLLRVTGSGKTFTMATLRPGMEKSRDEIIRKLINMQYTRNELDFKRGTFRAKGDVLEIYPSDQSETAVRVSFWGDEIRLLSMDLDFHQLLDADKKGFLRSEVEDIQAEYDIKEEETLEEVIGKLTEEMLKYAQNMEFEEAAVLRDKIKELEKISEL